jgi:glutaconate CoA-transferase subunit B
MTKKYATNYCPGEIMAVVMSKIIKEQGPNRSGAGTMSQIPLLAARLAQSTYLPDLLITSGPGGVAGSHFDKLSWYTGDYRIHVGAEYRYSLDEVMDSFGDPRQYWGRKGGFMGGFQIDKYGNVNMAFIGDQKKPKYRGPGTIGLMSTCFRSTNLFTHYHNTRIFVEKVDFISGAGYLDGPGAREKMGCPKGSGPPYVVTPLCLFDFDEKTKIMRIKSVHPGHTVEEVLSKTGFKPVVPKNVPETEPPTEEEVAFMRAMDPDGILPRLTG